jgi:HEAT repeat protein
LLVSIALAALLLVQLRKEPAYQGRPLSAWANDLRSGDARVRERALAALKQSPEGLEYLSQRVAARPGAIQRLTQIAGNHLPENLKRPFRRLFDPGKQILDKHLAAQALQQLGTNAAPAVPALGRMLREPNVLLSSTAGVTLGRIGPAALPVLTDALNDPDFNVRSVACVALGQLGTNAAPAVPRLCEILEQESGPIVASAASALTQVKEPAVDAVIPLLSRTNAATRRWAAYILGNAGTDANKAVPALVACTQDSQVQVRWMAVDALARLGQRSMPAAEALLSMLADPEATVRATAFGGLLNRPVLVRKNLDKIIPGLADHSPLVQANAAKAVALAGRYATNALPDLLELARGTNDMVRTSAIEAREAIIRSSAEKSARSSIVK